MLTHEQRLEKLKSSSGLVVSSMLSDEENAHRMKLIMDMYLAGYSIYRRLQYCDALTKMQQIPRNFNGAFLVLEDAGKSE